MKPVRRTTLTLALVAALAPAAAQAAPKVLKPGSRGKAVRVLQERLGLPADGIFGPRTARAVKRFQRRSRMPVTGRVDAVTRRLLGIDEAPSTGGTEAGEVPAATPAPAPVAAPPGAAASMVGVARSAVGRPYKAGAAGPDAFDCSGLVVWAAKAAGVALPRSSFAQYGVGTPVEPGAVQAGDLVFFDTAGPGASDVGIASSPSTVLSATTHGVREHPLDGPYWGEHYVGARRIGQ